MDRLFCLRQWENNAQVRCVARRAIRPRSLGFRDDVFYRGPCCRDAVRVHGREVERCVLILPCRTMLDDLRGQSSWVCFSEWPWFVIRSGFNGENGMRRGFNIHEICRSHSPHHGILDTRNMHHTIYIRLRRLGLRFWDWRYWRKGRISNEAAIRTSSSHIWLALVIVAVF